MSNPFNYTTECESCGSSDFVVSYKDTVLDKSDAISFLLSEGETHTLVSVDCTNCGNSTSRTVTNYSSS